MHDRKFELDFRSDESLQQLMEHWQWHEEPAEWHVDRQAGCLRIAPKPQTDFWQRTHYGFCADNGHFLYRHATGNFRLTTRVTSHPAHQYDQAGLMLRLSSTCWIKTSIEFEPTGLNRLGAVVTNFGYSDWSTQSISSDIDTIWLRITTEKSDCIIDASYDGLAWDQLRVTHLHERSDLPSVTCGIYACSPRLGGFHANFTRLGFEEL